jgi:2-keto-4-pentenoate hydratase
MIPAGRMLASAVLAGALTGCVAHGGNPAYLAQFIAAERAGLPFEQMTDRRTAARFDDAYRVQRGYVRYRLRAGDTVAGYKGGLMSRGSLKARNVTEPLVGTLFASGRAADGATISLCGYRKASFELKLGYVLPVSSRTRSL